MMSRIEYMLTELWTTRPNNIESTQPHTLTSTPATQNTVMVKKSMAIFAHKRIETSKKKSNTASYQNQHQQKQQKLFKKINKQINTMLETPAL